MKDAGKRNKEWMYVGSKTCGFLGQILKCKKETKLENEGESGAIQLERHQTKEKRKEEEKER